MKTRSFAFILVIGVIFLGFFSNCKKDNDSNPSHDTSVKDIDGNTYQTVQIGNQTWMVENLKTTRYNDSTLITNFTDVNLFGASHTGATCIFDNDEANLEIYGRLYNGYAVLTNKLAPKGWHVPTKAEIDTLIEYLGGSEIAGGKLKSTGSEWRTPNTGATNESGFNALPGGFAYFGYAVMGDQGSWWTISYSGLGHISYSVFHENSKIEKSYDMNTFGYSVRCLKD